MAGETSYIVVGNVTAISNGSNVYAVKCGRVRLPAAQAWVQSLLANGQILVDVEPVGEEVIGIDFEDGTGVVWIAPAKVLVEPCLVVETVWDGSAPTVALTSNGTTLLAAEESNLKAAGAYGGPPVLLAEGAEVTATWMQDSSADGDGYVVLAFTRL